MSNIGHISRSFSQTTTIHGMRRLNDGPLIYRLVWMLFVLGTFTGFFIHLGQLLSRYAEYPVNTENFEGVDDFQFPSVTICPNDYMHYDYRYNPIPSSLDDARSLYDMVYDLARVWHRIKNNNTYIPVYPYSEYDDGKNSLKQVAYRSRQFQTLQDTVVYCRYNSRDCSYDEFQVYKDPQNFLCFTFTPKNREGLQTDEGNGMFLILYSNSNSFLTEEEEINHIPGFSVTLHEPGITPNLASAIAVPLQQRVSVEVRQRTEIKLDRSAYHCSADLGKVTYVSDFSRSVSNPELVSFRAKQQDCLLRHRQLEFLHECGCLAEHLPIPVDLMSLGRPCHEMWEPMFFMDIRPPTGNGSTGMTIKNGSVVLDFEEFFQANSARWEPMRQAALCFDRVESRQSNLQAANGECIRLCQRTEFPVSITATRWPMDVGVGYSATAINSSLDLFLDRAIAKAEAATNDTLRSLRIAKKRQVPDKFQYFCLLDLHLSSNGAFHSREDWVYPLRNLLSDLGGILGLWIGASIITVVELMELLLRIAVSLSWRLRPAEKAPPTVDEKVSTPDTPV